MVVRYIEHLEIEKASNTRLERNAINIIKKAFGTLF